MSHCAKAKLMITRQRLKELMEYNDETGDFFWKIDRSPKTVTGMKAGSIGTRGYIYITIDYVQYRAHRLVFLYMTGRMPKIIDHVDGNTTNNAFGNLRAATASMNRANSKTNRFRKYQLSKGVTYCVSRNSPKKYRAQIYLHGKRNVIGYFETASAARAAYALAATEKFGEFATLP